MNFGCVAQEHFKKPPSPGTGPPGWLSELQEHPGSKVNSGPSGRFIPQIRASKSPLSFNPCPGQRVRKDQELGLLVFALARLLQVKDQTRPLTYDRVQDLLEDNGSNPCPKSGILVGVGLL